MNLYMFHIDPNPLPSTLCNDCDRPVIEHQPAYVSAKKRAFIKNLCTDCLQDRKGGDDRCVEEKISKSIKSIPEPTEVQAATNSRMGSGICGDVTFIIEKGQVHGFFHRLINLPGSCLVRLSIAPSSVRYLKSWDSEKILTVSDMHAMSTSKGEVPHS